MTGVSISIVFYNYAEEEKGRTYHFLVENIKVTSVFAFGVYMSLFTTL